MSTEMVINCLQDIWPKMFEGRRRLAFLVLFNLFVVAVCILFCTQGGFYSFILIDWYAQAWSALLVGLVECIVFMWIYGGDRISNDLQIMLGRPLPSLLRINAAFLTPVILVVLVVLSFAEYKPPKYGSYYYPTYAQVIGWTLTILVISPIFIAFAYKVCKTNGSLKQKMKAVTKPNKEWLPNDQSSLAKYRIDMLQRRTFWKIFLYNMFGKYRLFRAPEKDSGIDAADDSNANGEYLPMNKPEEVL